MHYCSNCGKKIQNGTQFCPYCGQKQHYMTNTNVSNENYNATHFNNNRHHIKHLGRWIIAAVVIIACIIGFAEYKKRTSLSYIISSHPWTAKYTDTKNPNGTLHTAGHKFTFKDNNIYKNGHKIGYYNLPSKNSINIRFKNHYHIQTHATVTKISSKELELVHEKSSMPKSYADKLVNKEHIDKSSLPQSDQKILNGQSVSADETTRFVAE